MNFIQTNKIENLSIITYIKNHSNKSIYTILILKDKRISCTSDQNKIDIYNQTTFEINISIKINEKCLTNLNQLKDGNLIIGTEKSIFIFGILKFSYFVVFNINLKEFIHKIIELNNNNLISCGKNSLILWENHSIFKNFLDKKNYSKKILLKKFDIFDAIEINKNEIVFKTFDFIIFWEIKSNKKLNQIKIKSSLSYSTFNKINKQILFFGAKENVYLIDTIKKEILNFFPIKSSTMCSCLFNCNNFFFILTGHSNGDFMQWKISNNQISFVSFKLNAHKSYVNCLRQFNNNFIISCSSDSLIKIWQ